jgi:hypothetical protein
MVSSKTIVPPWVLFIVALLCFAAIADLPYSYYRFLRWAVCAVAIVSTVQMHRFNRQGWVWILGTVAILFNPFVPISFEKSTWRIVDGAVGIVFLCVLRFCLGFKDTDKS